MKVCLSQTRPLARCRIWHTVKPGDTCYQIAQDNGLGLNDLENWNPGLINHNCGIRPGHQVCVDGYIGAVTTSDDWTEVHSLFPAEFNLRYPPSLERLLGNLTKTMEIKIDDPVLSPYLRDGNPDPRPSLTRFQPISWERIVSSQYIWPSLARFRSFLLGANIMHNLRGSSSSCRGACSPVRITASDQVGAVVNLTSHHVDLADNRRGE